MKIGILADIHEHLEHLQAAVALFRDSHVDQVVLLGDVFETGARIQETVATLVDVNAVGVWGNHDLGLSYNPDSESLRRYGESIVGFFGTLQTHFEVEDILFCHGMPTWDATDPAIYYLADSPWEKEALLPAFAAFPHRIMLIGHYHRWLLATPEGSTEWNGEGPIFFDPSQRYFLVLRAVFDGWCATLDTQTNEFTPCFIGGYS